jgi:hypothetical protein
MKPASLHKENAGEFNVPTRSGVSGPVFMVNRGEYLYGFRR